jgi:hypothetical protein
VNSYRGSRFQVRGTEGDVKSWFLNARRTRNRGPRAGRARLTIWAIRSFRARLGHCAAAGGETAPAEGAKVAGRAPLQGGKSDRSSAAASGGGRWGRLDQIWRLAEGVAMSLVI